MSSCCNYQYKESNGTLIRYLCAHNENKTSYCDGDTCPLQTRVAKRQLLDRRNQLIDRAETVAFEYAKSLDEGYERLRAFEIAENIRVARRA